MKPEAQPPEGAQRGAAAPADNSVSLVIPTLREYAFGEVLDRLLAHLRALPEYAFEIVVVDDSDADTFAQMNDVMALRRATPEGSPALRLVAGPRRGKGAAVRVGARAARGAVVFVMDADLPVPLRYVTEFLDKMRATGADVVIGERSRSRYADSPIRQFLSGGLRLIQQSVVFGGARFEDTQCGFKAFRAEALRGVTERQLVERGMYDLEYLYAATRRGLRIEVVAVEQNPEVRPTRIKLLSCVFYDPLDIARFRLSGAFGRYG